MLLELACWMFQSKLCIVSDSARLTSHPVLPRSLESLMIHIIVWLLALEDTLLNLGCLLSGLGRKWSGEGRLPIRLECLFPHVRCRMFRRGLLLLRLHR